MRKLLLGCLMLVCLGMQYTSAASISVYNNYQSWAAALTAAQPDASVVTESFDANAISTPGLSFTTESGMGAAEPGLGQIQSGKWVDEVGKNAPAAYDSTVISYNSNLFGIGGDWSISSSASGLEIWLNTATTPWVPVSPDAPNGRGAPAFGGWWGFISSEPFTQLRLSADSGATSYTLDNFSLGDPPASTTPEPDSAALTGLGLATAGLLRCVIRSKPGR